MAEPIESNQAPEPSAPQPPTSATPQPSATPTPPVSGPFASIERIFYDWFVYKAPFQLPSGLTDFIVKFGPWITLALAVLTLPILFGLMGVLFWASSIQSMAAPYGFSAASSALAWLALLALLLQLIVMFVSVPMLLKRRRLGWQLVFYATLVNLAYSIVSGFAYGVYGIGSIVWGLITAAISLYILFQVRRYYTN